MRVSNGLELELRALKRAIEARRDRHEARRASGGRVVEEHTKAAQLFHHVDDPSAIV